MSRTYSMLHRVSYAQIMTVLRAAGKPLTSTEIYNQLPCEPEIINFEVKLYNMAEKGMIQKGTTPVYGGGEIYTWAISSKERY